MSGGSGGLPSKVSSRGATKEVKGNVWVHQSQLVADGGSGGGWQIQGSGGGGDRNLFLGCAMCLWGPRSGGLVYCSNFFVKYFYSKEHLGSIRFDRK